ncbi:MAG: TIGR04076 family protein [Candidatus Bathyarchaeota archaeon]|nr:TIGR04076 family protein [Candidatus Bathyarchaeum tardum]
MLEITVHEIRGKCPVHKVGDKIIVDDPKIALDNTDALCTHALSTILHYVLILEAGADPVRLGLTKPGDNKNAYLQCVDPGQPYTDGGTVIFKIRKLNKD